MLQPMGLAAGLGAAGTSLAQGIVQGQTEGLQRQRDEIATQNMQQQTDEFNDTQAALSDASNQIPSTGDPYADSQARLNAAADALDQKGRGRAAQQLRDQAMGVQHQKAASLMDKYNLDNAGVTSQLNRLAGNRQGIAQAISMVDVNPDAAVQSLNALQGPDGQPLLGEKVTQIQKDPSNPDMLNVTMENGETRQFNVPQVMDALTAPTDERGAMMSKWYGAKTDHMQNLDEAKQIQLKMMQDRYADQSKQGWARLQQGAQRIAQGGANKQTQEQWAYDKAKESNPYLQFQDFHEWYKSGGTNMGKIIAGIQRQVMQNNPAAAYDPNVFDSAVQQQLDQFVGLVNKTAPPRPGLGGGGLPAAPPAAPPAAAPGLANPSVPAAPAAPPAAPPVAPPAAAPQLNPPRTGGFVSTPAAAAPTPQTRVVKGRTYVKGPDNLWHPQ